jgi:hypothetical protein
MNKINVMVVLAVMLTLTGCGLNSKQQSSIPASIHAEPEPEASSTIQALPSPSAASVSADDIYRRTISPSALTSLLPEGWHVLEEESAAQAEGDLNQDGIPDLAIVVEKTIHSEQAAPRMLLIALGNKDQTYSVSLKSEHAILRADEGGVWGDPFDSVTIDRGSVLLHFYGGSNHRWFSTYRFRFQDQDWYLIGATLGSYFTGTQTKENADLEDYNLLTGDYIIRKTDDKGNVNTTKGNRGKKALLKLTDFDIRVENQY